MREGTVVFLKPNVDAKKVCSSACDSRRYTYFFPSYILLPTTAPENNTDPATTSPEERMARKRAWRVDAAQVERLRETAQRFVGTHNFHNFTVGRDFKDPSSHRFMKKLEVPSLVTSKFPNLIIYRFRIR